MFRNCIFLLFTTSLVLFSYIHAYSQSEEDKELSAQYLEQAELILEETQALDLARELYVQAADLDPSNVVANYKAADTYLNTVHKDRAKKYFLRVLNLDPDYRFNLMYTIGRSYQYAMDFENALTYYNRYRRKLLARDEYRGRDKTQLPDVNRRIYECENAKEFVANPAHFSIVNIGSAINSDAEDYAPVLNADETQIVFTSRRRDGNLNENVALDNKPYEDIFISQNRNGRWSSAENIGDVVNTEYHDSNLALSSEGTQLFLYKDENNGDIYTTNQRDDGSWSLPEAMEETINSSYSENSVSLSPDGEMLFFSSDRPGGYGEEGTLDIYVSIKDKNGKWGRAKNLGSKINTEFNDDGPFLDYDGKTLYFSSKGLKGMGGYDIFKSEYDSANQEWADPVNLGFPINTPDDDIYFVSTRDGQRGYYASVREDGLGYTDIYMVTVPEDKDEPDFVASKDNDSIEEEDGGQKDIANLRSVETNQTNNNSTNVNSTDNTDRVAEGGETGSEIKVDEKPKAKLVPTILTLEVKGNDVKGGLMDAKVSLRSVGDNVMVPAKRLSTGVYQFSIKNKNARQYQLSVESSGYLFSNTKFNVAPSTTDGNTLSKQVTLRKLRAGVSKVLRNIYFEFDKATFTTESYNELNKLEKMLADNSNMIVEISGHTDKVGGKNYNLHLSQKRASAVADYLVNKGIDSRKVKAVGYGSQYPLASNDDEREGRELNRRVEFKVLKSDS